jgi:hypothetical protein
MPEVAAHLLATSVLRTLQDAAFLLAEESDGAPPFEGEVLEARIAWGGDDPAELRLALEPGLAAELAANLLGEDGATAAQGADALGELLNMAAGALLAGIHGARGAPPLGLPRVAAVRAADRARGLAGALTVTLLDEGGRRLDVALVRPGRPA